MVRRQKLGQRKVSQDSVRGDISGLFRPDNFAEYDPRGQFDGEEPVEVPIDDENIGPRGKRRRVFNAGPYGENPQSHQRAVIQHPLFQNDDSGSQPAVVENKGFVDRTLDRVSLITNGVSFWTAAVLTAAGSTTLALNILPDDSGNSLTSLGLRVIPPLTAVFAGYFGVKASEAKGVVNNLSERITQAGTDIDTNTLYENPRTGQRFHLAKTNTLSRIGSFAVRWCALPLSALAVVAIAGSYVFNQVANKDLPYYNPKIEQAIESGKKFTGSLSDLLILPEDSSDLGNEYRIPAPAPTSTRYAPASTPTATLERLSATPTVPPTPTEMYERQQTPEPTVLIVPIPGKGETTPEPTPTSYVTPQIPNQLGDDVVKAADDFGTQSTPIPNRANPQGQSLENRTDLAFTDERGRARTAKFNEQSDCYTLNVIASDGLYSLLRSMTAVDKRFEGVTPYQVGRPQHPRERIDKIYVGEPLCIKPR